MPIWGGGSGGGAGSDTTATHLLGVSSPTDGVTAAAVNSAWTSFSTAWTLQVTTTATADVIIEVTLGYRTSASATLFALKRGASVIYNTGQVFNNGTANTSLVHFSFVDKALAAGTYTYEIQCGGINSTTVTLTNAAAAFNLSATSGAQSQMRISQAANV